MAGIVLADNGIGRITKLGVIVLADNGIKDMKTKKPRKPFDLRGRIDRAGGSDRNRCCDLDYVILHPLVFLGHLAGQGCGDCVPHTGTKIGFRPVFV